MYIYIMIYNDKCIYIEIMIYIYIHMYIMPFLYNDIHIYIYIYMYHIWVSWLSMEMSIKYSSEL